ncbi:MobL relaxases [Caprobacter fermentans]|uniref:MobL relaxases n=1 Tax=Caproicibacter fermentans TaxID=2576756 RepID=A0A6N8HVN8_9FIRM|nr:MobP3 family relaxase [Caproicibacter fermentans]MVB09665.1 MobL relaxases [Caproicibacter fermentans]
MPRIIFKCRYLKNAAAHAENLVTYVATREGVEKIPRNWRSLPATEKQKQLIADILARFPDSDRLFEYEDYQNSPTAGNASELILAALDQNLDQPSHQEVYVNYIATRPRAEKLGAHGLFSDENTPLVLSRVAEEAAQHTGNIWTPIISLRREDAARLGYDNAVAWMALLRKQRNIFAEQMKIAPENLRWYAAFHNEGHHPHCHMIVYSADPREGYVTKPAIEKMRSGLAREIFQQDLLQIYSEQTERRDSLTTESRDTLRELLEQMKNGTCANPVIEDLISRLAERLKYTAGKKQYGYLKAPLKEMVNQIVDELAKDERVAAAYAEWQELRNEVLHTYKDHLPEPQPLSQQKEFKQIKNMVIAEAVSLGSHHFIFEGDEDAEAAFEEEHFEDYADTSDPQTEKHTHEDDTSTVNPPNEIERLQKLAAQGNSFAQYRLGKLYLLGEDVLKDVGSAIRWLTASAEQGNQYAQYALGKLYLAGRDVPRDREAAIRWLTRSAKQGNIYARFFLDHPDSFRDPSLSLAATRLLHHLSHIFREEQDRLPGGPRMQVESKLRRKIRQKKIAQGHAPDDHEQKFTTY